MILIDTNEGLYTRDLIGNISYGPNYMEGSQIHIYRYSCGIIVLSLMISNISRDHMKSFLWSQLRVILNMLYLMIPRVLNNISYFNILVLYDIIWCTSTRSTSSSTNTPVACRLRWCHKWWDNWAVGIGRLGSCETNTTQWFYQRGEGKHSELTIDSFIHSFIRHWCNLYIVSSRDISNTTHLQLPSPIG